MWGIALTSPDGTNLEGMELSSVVAERNGLGYPTTFLLTRPKPIEKVTKAIEVARKGAKLAIVTSWLAQLRSLGCSPTFVHSDKDFAEISAVHDVWLTTKIQLCYWHVGDALRKRLAKAAAVKPVYHPADAKTIVHDLDWVRDGHDPKQQQRSGFTFGSATARAAAAAQRPAAGAAPPMGSGIRLSAESLRKYTSLDAAGLYDFLEDATCDAFEEPDPEPKTGKRKVGAVSARARSLLTRPGRAAMPC
jgi:hypothetical protein